MKINTDQSKMTLSADILKAGGSIEIKEATVSSAQKKKSSFLKKWQMGWVVLMCVSNLLLGFNAVVNGDNVVNDHYRMLGSKNVAELRLNIEEVTQSPQVANLFKTAADIVQSQGISLRGNIALNTKLQDTESSFAQDFTARTGTYVIQIGYPAQVDARARDIYAIKSAFTVAHEAGHAVNSKHVDHHTVYGNDGLLDMLNGGDNAYKTYINEAEADVFAVLVLAKQSANQPESKDFYKLAAQYGYLMRLENAHTTSHNSSGFINNVIENAFSSEGLLKLKNMSEENLIAYKNTVTHQNVMSKQEMIVNAANAQSIMNPEDLTDKTTSQALVDRFADGNGVVNNIKVQQQYNEAVNNIFSEHYQKETQHVAKKVVINSLFDQKYGQLSYQDNAQKIFGMDYMETIEVNTSESASAHFSKDVMTRIQQQRDMASKHAAKI